MKISTSGCGLYSPGERIIVETTARIEERATETDTFWFEFDEVEVALKTETEEMEVVNTLLAVEIDVMEADDEQVAVVDVAPGSLFCEAVIFD